MKDYQFLFQFYENELSERQKKILKDYRKIMDSLPLSSEWERLDMDYFIFSKTLSSTQFAIYERVYKQELEVINSEAKLQDISDNALNYYINLRKIYETSYNSIFSRIKVENITFKNTIQEIKTDYKTFIDSQLKDTIILNLRLSRNYNPKQIQASILEHSLDYIIPNTIDYYSNTLLTEKIDYLLKAIRPLYENEVLMLKSEIENVNSVADVLVKKHNLVDLIPSYSVPQIYIEKEHYLLCIILFDRDKYNLGNLGLFDSDT